MPPRPSAISAPNSRRRLAPWILAAPGALWLVLFCVVPVIALLHRSVAGAGGAWWDGYERAFAQYGGHLARSFGYASVATLLALAMGYPLAYVIAFRSGRRKNFLLGLVALPLLVTFLVRTFAWKTIFNDHGVVVAMLGALHLLPPEHRLLDTVWAVLGGLTYNFLPFMVLPIYVSLEKIDRRLVEAAQDLYSNSRRAFLRVVLPLSLPGVLAGTLLTFIPAAGDFINAELLGGPNQQMIGSVVQTRFLVVRDYPLAAALSVVLMVILFALVVAYTRFLGTEDLL
ncbi:MAG TPA: ABC transporter permease [Gemmatimonadaceae bacterium]|nr:ABC transporter permease [Gemmatimonadaceae bacterium]